MKRVAMAKLEKWHQNKGRKPLLLRGARQVGKTWLAREFGKNFSSFVELNLEARPELSSLFEQFFGEPKLLVEQLSLVLGTPILPGQTLLFLDEIQEVPKALLALRYFYEHLQSLAVIAAGSLLEFALKDLSFPVGRIEFLYLFPLNFYEFLEAQSESEIVNFLKVKKAWIGLDNSEESLKKNGSISYREFGEVSSALHSKLISHLKSYCFLGGMPEVVQTYVETRDIRRCFEIQGELVSNFRLDFNKYASRAKVPLVRLLFDAVPTQFAKKFVYANVGEGLKAREVRESLELLSNAGLIYQCFHSSGNGVPLSAEINHKKFKVYFVDIGLSLRALGFKPQDFPTSNLSDLINQGGIMEQFVCQEILSRTEKGASPQVFYWLREALNASAEIDFLIDHGKKVVPLEVKSSRHRFSKSLSIFIKEKQSPLAYYISSDPTKVLEPKEGSGITSKVINLSFYHLPNIFDEANSE